MSPSVLYFASGDSLYLGAGLLLLTIAVSPYLKRSWLLRLRNIIAWLSLAMIVMASPPFAWIVDLTFLTAFALWFVTSNQDPPTNKWGTWNFAARTVLIVLLLVLPIVELSHRKTPAVAGIPSDHLVVIGDSISSGLNSRSAWPVVMEQKSGIPVMNLASPGATTLQAQEMAARLKPEDHLVLVEIGGNDMLSGLPSNEFGQALDSLLSRIYVPGRTVVMFELPLLPHQIGYGRIQRRLAAKYGVVLIPKRYLVDVIGSANATSDGLHLSDVGSRRMATIVEKILAPVLKQPS